MWFLNFLLVNLSKIIQNLILSHFLGNLCFFVSAFVELLRRRILIRNSCNFNQTQIQVQIILKNGKRKNCKV
jgi:hypothetical protein